MSKNLQGSLSALFIVQKGSEENDLASSTESVDGCPFFLPSSPFFLPLSPSLPPFSFYLYFSPQNQTKAHINRKIYTPGS